MPKSESRLPTSPKKRNSRQPRYAEQPGVTEHGMQVALFEWRGWRVNQLPALRLLYAIPNGGYRPKVTGRRMKAEGAKRGIPDTHLAVARQGFHSLYIELKRPGGASSPEQLEMQALLREAGHRVEVCYSTLDAIDVIEEYLGVPEAERSRHAYLY